MNVYEAIMKAADQIERYPKTFNFDSVDFPDCGSPSCALGWIGHFLGYTEKRWGTYEYGVAEASKDLGTYFRGHSNCEFYHHMNVLCGNVMGWREKATVCANTLRLYAAKYHAPAKPRRTDSDLVSDLMTRVTNGERIPEDA